MERPNAWKSYSEEDNKKLEELNKDYIDFLSEGKTEREVTELIKERSYKAGYRDINEFIREGQPLKPGDKIIAVNMNKSVVLFQIGQKGIEQGMNILGAHIDSPRLDVKQNPLYESEELAYFDTHYYGGIKKYQYVTLPLAIHGVIVKKDGTSVTVKVGEDLNDPVFCISDLLIHLAGDQMTKTAAKVVEGEKLDVIVGGRPVAGNDDEKDAVKKNILRILNEKYGIDEEDFLSAELEVVPAGRARELGFDRSMILSYGQDDRVCAFTSLVAMLEAPVPEKTAVCLLVDKEEIGSVGATGMQSHFFENMVAELISLGGDYSDLLLKRALRNSRMLSSDVNAGYDPLYADAFDKNNASYLGRGIVFCKFTGARGKSGSNDANAEYLAALRKIMDDNNVKWQTAELGKVDQGGGGTIAYILSLYGMEVVDSGVAVLSMHSPWEITSKADVYEAEKCYEAFIREA